ncbi:MAG: tetratricopeptide repeat protein [Pseudomonadota bacterium]
MEKNLPADGDKESAMDKVRSDAAEPFGSGEQPDLNQTIAALRESFAEQPGGTRWRRDLTFVAFAVLAVAIAIWYTQYRVPARYPLTAFAVIETSVPPTQAWMGIGFAQGLASYLQATGTVRVLTDQAPQTVLTNLFGLSLEPVSANAADFRLDVALTTSSRDLLTASVSLVDRDNPTRRFDAELTGSAANLSDLAARVSLQVFDWLEVNPFSPEQRDVATAAIPADNDDLAHYARALQRLQQGLSREAITHFQNIPGVATMPMANAGLARAYDDLGYSSIAQDHISRASEGRHALTRELQLNIQAQYHRLHSEWPRAQELYQALREFYPEKVEYALLLAKVLVRSGDGQAALALLDTIAEDQRFSTDPAVDMTRMLVLYEIGEWRAAMASADLAIAKAEQIGARGLAAHARYRRHDMNPELTDSGPVEAAFDEFVALNNQRGQVNALSKLGSLAKEAGRLDLASEFKQRAFELAQALQNPQLINSVLAGRAMLFDLMGDLEAGLVVKQSIVRNWEELGRLRRVGISRENVVVSLYKMGRMAQARDALERARVDFLAADDRIGLAWYPDRLGGIYMRMGDLAKAEPLFEQALTNAETHPAGGLALHARHDLAQLSFYRGEVDARVLLEASREEFVAGNHRMFVSQADLFLAQLEETPAGALALTEQALERFEEQNAGYYVTYGLTLAVRAGDMSRCALLRSGVENLAHRLYALLGHVALHACGPGMALLSLEDIDAEAQALELFEPRLEVAAMRDVEQARAWADAQGWFQPKHWSY